MKGHNCSKEESMQGDIRNKMEKLYEYDNNTHRYSLLHKITPPTPPKGQSQSFCTLN